MSNTRRLMEAAAALSNLLRSRKVGHAFHGGLLIAALSNYPECDVSMVVILAMCKSDITAGNLLCCGGWSRTNAPVSQSTRLRART